MGKRSCIATVGGFLVFVFLLGIGITVPVFPAAAAGVSEASNLANPLLVVSFLLSVCILAISGFTLWQSHRYYLDTVRLSREITGTTTELHQKIVELIYSLKDFLAHESEMVTLRDRRSKKNVPHEPMKDVEKIVEDINETESKIRALEQTLSKLNEQLSFNFSNALSRKLAALNDIEYAVLLKLSQDPKFFEKHSFTSFGATPKVLDSLLSRQLIVFDSDGKAEVPKEVAIALTHPSRGN